MTAEASVVDRVTALLDRYERSLYNYLLALTHDREVASDCLQHAFLTALEQFGRGREVNAAWLYKVARNKWIDETRHRRRVAPGEEPLEDLEARPQNTRAAEVERVLQRLTPEERELLYLYDVDGFTAKEIGQMIGARVSAVRMRVLRARRRFREVYAGEGGDHATA